MQQQGCPKHLGRLQPAPKGWQRSRLLLSKDWVGGMGTSPRRSAEKAQLAPGTVLLSILSLPAPSPGVPKAPSPPPPTWYLPLAPKRSPSLSQVTMGLGFPNAMQVRVTLLPSFASTYCGGVSVNVGGAGGTGDHRDPQGHSGFGGTRGQKGSCCLHTGDTLYIPTVGL